MVVGSSRCHHHLGQHVIGSSYSSPAQHAAAYHEFHFGLFSRVSAATRYRRAKCKPTHFHFTDARRALSAACLVALSRASGAIGTRGVVIFFAAAFPSISSLALIALGQLQREKRGLMGRSLHDAAHSYARAIFATRIIYREPRMPPDERRRSLRHTHNAKAPMVDAGQYAGRASAMPSRL